MGLTFAGQGLKVDSRVTGVLGGGEFAGVDYFASLPPSLNLYGTLSASALNVGSFLHSRWLLPTVHFLLLPSS